MADPADHKVVASGVDEARLIVQEKHMLRLASESLVYPTELSGRVGDMPTSSGVPGDEPPGA